MTEPTMGCSASDLRDYLTRKRNINQMQSHCCCEKLISVVFSQCPCRESAHKSSVFKRLIEPSTISSSRRRHFRPKKQASKNCHTEVTINMVSKGKSKASADSSESSDLKYSSGLDEAEEEPKNLAIATSQPSNTDQTEQASSHMAGSEEDLARQMEEQQSTIRQQQESIRRLEAMVEKLLGEKAKEKKKKKVHPQASGSRLRRPSHTEGENSRRHQEGNNEDDEEEKVVSVHSESSEAESNPRTKGDQVENMLKRMNVVEPQESQHKKGGGKDNYNSQKQSKGNDTLAVERAPSPKSSAKQKESTSDNHF
ncbi:serrate RNA effector molecule homolog [Asparagus officinalis]|uniref:serrate RNA effector molecule homolog n=1 Tax=Asparagus officinalis TaxID=4686 RepID=UPI00098E4E30|nr:serrate RNA effector molecule homolog [Asparagus officinalis]